MLEVNIGIAPLSKNLGYTKMVHSYHYLIVSLVNRFGVFNFPHSKR